MTETQNADQTTQQQDPATATTTISEQSTQQQQTDQAATDAAAALAAESQSAPKIWGDDLDDELKEFVKDKTPAQVAKELKGAQALLGKKTIGIPDKDSTPEQWRAFHESRGVPKDEAGYSFDATLDELMKEAPEGIERDPAREAEFRAMAKAANLSNTEANELIKRQLQKEWAGSKTQLAEISAANKQAQTLLDDAWGAKKDEYTQDANKFARHIGLGDDVLEVFMKAAGTKPEARFKFVNFMREQGALLKEGGDGGPLIDTGAEALTPAQATEKKTAYLSQGDNQAAYLDAGHPRHKQVSAQMTLYLKAERGIK